MYAYHLILVVMAVLVEAAELGGDLGCDLPVGSGDEAVAGRFAVTTDDAVAFLAQCWL